MALLPDEEQAFSYIYQKELDLREKSLSDLRQIFIRTLEESPVEHPQGNIFVAGSFLFELAHQNAPKIDRQSLEHEWKRLFGKALEGDSVFPESLHLNHPKPAQAILQAAGRYAVHFRASLRRKTNPATILSVNRFIKFVVKNLPKLPEAKK